MNKNSTKPLPQVQFHPLHALMRKFVTEGGEPVRELLLKMRERGIEKFTPQLVNKKDLNSFMENEAKDEVRQLVAAVSALRKGIPDHVEPDVNTLKPPSASVVYGTFAKRAEIHDVGCGDGKRLMSFKDLDIEGSEKSDIQLKDNTGVKKNDNWEKSERTLTSFNVLTQDATLESKFQARDGVHLYPNLPKMEKFGYSKKQEDGNYLTKIGDNTYTESKPTTAGSSYGFYEMKQHFAPRKMKFKIKEQRIGKTTCLKATGVKGVVPHDDIDAIQYKYDGERARLSFLDGVGVLQMEDGTQYDLEVVHDPGINVILTLEMMKDHAYLIAIKYYKNWFPHPTRQSLEAFETATGLDILENFDIRMPELYDPVKYEDYITRGYVDGLIYKSGLKDYCIKHTPSFDIDMATYIDLIDKLRENSLPVTFDTHPGGGTYEFEADPTEDGWHMRLKRKRHDNKKINSADDCVRMLTWKYVQDLGITEQMSKHIRLEPGEAAPTTEERLFVERDVFFEECKVN